MYPQLLFYFSPPSTKLSWLSLLLLLSTPSPLGHLVSPSSRSLATNDCVFLLRTLKVVKRFRAGGHVRQTLDNRRETWNRYFVPLFVSLHVPPPPSLPPSSSTTTFYFFCQNKKSLSTNGIQRWRMVPRCYFNEPGKFAQGLKSLLS